LGAGIKVIASILLAKTFEAISSYL